MVEQVELLGRVLGDAVDVDRRDGVLLVDGEVPRFPEDLPGRRVDDGGGDVLAPEEFEEAELARGVHAQVEERIVHRIDVAHLAGQVEDELSGQRRGAHFGPLHVAEISLDHCDRRVWRTGTIRDPAVGDQVGRVGPMARDPRVEDRHLGAAPREAQREVGSDEAESAGDEAPTPGEGFSGHGIQSAGQCTRPGRSALAIVGTRPHRDPG